MITFFTTTKAFKGHFKTIQTNAIKSWLAIKPRPEIILFGNENGTEQFCKNSNLKHIPLVETNEYGTPLLNDIIEKGQEYASNDLVCYINCDIILLKDFMDALLELKDWGKPFLMVGQRWDVDIDHEIDFSDPDYDENLQNIISASGFKRPPQWIDYFVFPKGILKDIHPFAVGRPYWDNWFLWNARKSGLNVVDVSDFVMPIHQNHDYSHHSEGLTGVWEGKEAEVNYKLLGGMLHFHTIEDAPFLLTDNGVKKNITRKYLNRRFEHLVLLRLKLLFWSLMSWSRPLRHFLGIKSSKNQKF